ncbi:CBF/Mak21 family-domain-containing protein [Fomitopsis serialis]|uniref:CBF/Mak21 family-domain-containing protein n=1 Tax=Fomitopsis serialis TaxID=139415 RepID=UPI002008DB52|nr:CBF/Mak21 family-domain-containing protein [Neoantrodia serialis]KAH9916522.1 CBF/Mak21 family-domain-containing protein [Neoantrodia serialis]
MARMRKDKHATMKSGSLSYDDTQVAAAKERRPKDGKVELVTDYQAEDPALVKDVSSFLSELKSPSGAGVAEPSAKKKSKTKDTPTKDSRQKNVSETARPRTDAKVPHHKKQKGPTNVAATASSKRGKFTVDPNPQWYTSVPALPPSTSLAQPTAQQLASLSARAQKALQADAELYASSSLSSGDASFMQTILKSGTLSDRLSALTLMVQGSPVHNVKALEGLKSMMERGKGKGREEGLKAVRCVVDWWVGGGGPGRKLKYFRDQPLLHPSATDAHLVLWHFEDWLKKYFFSVLQVLETYSLDPLAYVRTQSLAFLTALLKEQPEQEQNLLRLLANKLGDTEKAICSRASYHLLQVLQAHPAMKAVVVREVKALVFRPLASSAAAANASAAAHEEKRTHIRFGDEEETTAKTGKSAPGKKEQGKGRESAKERLERWNSHAWYYAAVTLNQAVLTPTEADRAVARTLLGVYFEMFEEILGAGREKGKEREGDDEGGDVGGGKGEKGGKEAGKRPDKGKGKEKEVRGAAGFAEVEDATSRLLSAVLTGVNRALPFAKVDVAGDDVFQKHIDTLFLITHTSTFNISLQALLLIFQITASLASHPSSSTASAFATALQDRFYRTLYASLVDSRLGESNKQAMYLNLLFKALKADKNIERAKAFVRRFVQVLVAGIGGGGGAEFVAGGLYLLGELFQTTPALKELLDDTKGKGKAPAQAGEESEYDPRKRDPQFAHASASPMYELLPLLHHYHPTISLHARQLFTSAPLTAAPDLALNTLSHFLDRFVYKNPKQPRTKGPSAMQPAASAADGTGVKMTKGEVVDEGGMVVNEEGWWRKKVEDVPADQIFFHKYFTQKKQREEEKATKVSRRRARGDAFDTDEDEENEEEDIVSEPEESPEGEDEHEAESDKGEAEIWKAMKASLPAELQDDDLIDDSDDDEDEIPSGLDDDDDSAADGEGLDGNTADAALGDSGASSDEGEQDLEDRDDDSAADEDAFSLVEASDAEDLIPLDADMGLVEYDGSDASDQEEEEWGGIDADQSAKKRKRTEEDSKKGRKKKLRLPTFASYEDYARMIEDGPEDNL